MPDWIANNPPLAVIAIIAVATVLIKFGVWVGAINRDRSAFREFMQEVKDDIKQILLRLPPPVATSASPLQLTEYGESISRAIEADALALDLARSLIGSMQGKSPYEIQEACFEHTKERSNLAPDKRAAMETYAFDNGLDLNVVLKVVAIELRDVILQQLQVSRAE